MFNRPQVESSFNSQSLRANLDNHKVLSHVHTGKIPGPKFGPSWESSNNTTGQ
jgi:hypothetical protein